MPGSEWLVLRVELLVAGFSTALVGRSALDDCVETSTMSITGELVTEPLEYNGGRAVTVYVQPEPPEAVVFAGDGQLISQWGNVLEAADVPPTMIVGAHRLPNETLRLHEYSPGFSPERFAAHERFFVEDIRRWVRARFGVALPT